MSKEVYGLITFKSSNYALQTEEVLKEDEIAFKTIPTPREVSHSCGLAILFILDDLDRVKKYIEEGQIMYDNLFKFTKENHKNMAEKII